jgi:hypothetical protein
MQRDINTADPLAVAQAVQAVYVKLFPQADRAWISRVFGWTVDCFAGRYADYLPVDTRYHNLEHTLQGALCLARLLGFRELAGARPAMTQAQFELGMLAMLMHDTGYLKDVSDKEGTGAKYTWVHVDRSVLFTERLLAEKGYSTADRRSVENMIRCTGRNTHPQHIAFGSELEKIVGCGLGTSDYLGQMAAHDYVEKLPCLYSEFQESVAYQAKYDPTPVEYSCAEDLMEKTLVFWETLVWPKLETEFLGLYRYLNQPYPDGPNAYLLSIEANLERIRQRIKKT